MVSAAVLLSLGVLALAGLGLVQPKPDDEAEAEAAPEPEPEPPVPVAIELSTGKRVDVSHHKNIGLLPTVQECGFVVKDETSKIGATRLFTPRSQAKYPWLVRLVVEDMKGIRTTGCAGTLISSRHVLTSAACLVGIGTGSYVTNIIVGGQGTTCEVGNGKCSSGTKIIEVEEAIAHPDFVGPTKQNDIGIVRLKKEVVFENTIRPVCLPLSEELYTTLKNNKTTVLGWAKMEDSSLAGLMMYSRNVVSWEMTLDVRSYCDRFYKRSHAKFGPGRFCASGDGSKSICTEEDGGPGTKTFSIPDLSQDRTFQIGVVSFQHKLCGQPGIPGAFTNVIHFMPWVLDNLFVGE